MPKIPTRSGLTATLTPLWQTSDKETVRLYQGDTLAVLPQLPAKSVHCVLTSPPYWSIRDGQRNDGRRLHRTGEEVNRH